MRGEIRWDVYGKVRAMTAPVDHYLMVRRPHCGPFVMHEREWAKLATTEAAADHEVRLGVAKPARPDLEG